MGFKEPYQYPTLLCSVLSIFLRSSRWREELSGRDLKLLAPCKELEPVLVAAADDGILIIKLLTAQICAAAEGVLMIELDSGWEA